VIITKELVTRQKPSSLLRKSKQSEMWGEHLHQGSRGLNSHVLSQLGAITVFTVAPKIDGSTDHQFILDDSKVQERF